jgi:hypothetical protein
MFIKSRSEYEAHQCVSQMLRTHVQFQMKQRIIAIKKVMEQGESARTDNLSHIKEDFRVIPRMDLLRRCFPEELEVPLIHLAVIKDADAIFDYLVDENIPLHEYFDIYIETKRFKFRI